MPPSEIIVELLGPRPNCSSAVRTARSLAEPMRVMPILLPLRSEPLVMAGSASSVKTIWCVVVPIQTKSAPWAQAVIIGAGDRWPNWISPARSACTAVVPPRI